MSHTRDRVVARTCASTSCFLVYGVVFTDVRPRGAPPWVARFGDFKKSSIAARATRHRVVTPRAMPEGASRRGRVTADDPYAFDAIARAKAYFDDVDAAALPSESDDDDDDGRRRTTTTTTTTTTTRRGVGVSVFARGGAVPATARAMDATGARTTATDGTADGGAARTRDDDVVVVDDAVDAVRPAEDLFDEVAVASPRGKRGTRELTTLARSGAKKRREAETARAEAETTTTTTTDARESDAMTIRRETSTSTAVASGAVPAVKKRVTLGEFVGEEEKKDLDYDDDDADRLMPQSGAQLADIDEANYAISGLSSARDFKEKIRSVGVLVNLLSNQRTRRLMASYGLPSKIIQATQEVAVLPNAPKTLLFGCAAIFYLCGESELRKPASGSMLNVKLAKAIRALLRASNASGEAMHVKTNSAIRACLKTLKFLPHEAKDEKTLALLIAHQALRAEQDALLASGSGPGSATDDNSFREIMARQGAVLATCELVAQATKTLQRFGDAYFASTAPRVYDDEDEDNNDVTDDAAEQDAARAIARLFRCSRVLECASFESRESCDIISVATLVGTSKSAEAPSLQLIPLSSARVTANTSAPSAAPIDIPMSPSPVKSRVPGGITMTPPSSVRRGGFAKSITVDGGGDDDDDDDAMIVPSSPLSPPIVGNVGRGAAIQWLADNVQTPVKGSSPRARTAVRALVDVIPTLAAMTSASVIGSKRGDTIANTLRVRYNGAIAIDHRVAVGALKAVLSTLTNVTNENEEGAGAVVGDDHQGLLQIASLVPWLALTIEGFTLRDGRDRRRTRVPADDSGSSLLNATLVLLVNIVEADAESATTLQNCSVKLPGSSETSISFVDALAVLYLQAVDAEEANDEAEAEATHVTAEMIKSMSSKNTGEDLILQAYSGLLLAFLIEGQPALRADVVSRFASTLHQGDGEPRLKPLADTLERFHAFHESVNTLSAKSSERLERVVKWLR